VKEFS